MLLSTWLSILFFDAIVNESNTDWIKYNVFVFIQSAFLKVSQHKFTRLLLPQPNEALKFAVVGLKSLYFEVEQPLKNQRLMVEKLGV